MIRRMATRSKVTLSLPDVLIARIDNVARTTENRSALYERLLADAVYRAEEAAIDALYDHIPPPTEEEQQRRRAMLNYVMRRRGNLRPDDWPDAPVPPSRQAQPVNG
jgi:hypothetical protein